MKVTIKIEANDKESLVDAIENAADAIKEHLKPRTDGIVLDDTIRISNRPQSYEGMIDFED